MAASEPCPHCGGLSWYVTEGKELWHKCICGYCTLVITTLADGTVIYHTQAASRVQLPRKGTQLSQCFGMVISLYPEEHSTADIAGRMNCDTADIANQLMVLMHKGLVERVEVRRGLPGGSTWSLTHRAMSKINMAPRR